MIVKSIRNRFIYPAKCKKICIVHDIVLGATGWMFKNYIVFISLKIEFIFSNSEDPDEMPHFVKCDISSGSSLFVKITVFVGFSMQSDEAYRSSTFQV